MTTPDRRLTRIARSVTECDRCPELRRYCADVGREKKRAFADWTYWARPVPGFGDPNASIVIVGLAPAAHGANRTGRMFTGDRSGDFLYAGLHRAGFASQAEATHRDDGLTLHGIYITAALRCAPPANKPTADQLERCRPHLVAELEVIQPRVLLCLGRIGWDSALSALRQIGHPMPRPRPRFGHGAFAEVGRVALLGCYHVSQQNTFTGRLTESMFDDILDRAGTLANVGR